MVGLSRAIRARIRETDTCEPDPDVSGNWTRETGRSGVVRDGGGPWAGSSMSFWMTSSSSRAGSCGGGRGGDGTSLDRDPKEGDSRLYEAQTSVEGPYRNLVGFTSWRFGTGWGRGLVRKGSRKDVSHTRDREGRDG